MKILIKKENMGSGISLYTSQEDVCSSEQLSCYHQRNINQPNLL